MNRLSKKTILYFCLIWSLEIAVTWLLFDLVSNFWLNRLNNSLFSFENLVESEEITVNKNAQSLSTLPLFTTGTAQQEIFATLGEPASCKPGYWANSIACSYKNMLSWGIDLGFIFDSQTKKLRQAEIAVPSSVELEALYGVVEHLIDYTYLPATIERQLAAVYWRETNSQTFEIDNLEAVIKRHEQDRIYIGVWEQYFHQV
ncbi:MAG: hypothetical protein QNJ72_04790 [Pleurocapsa sp. MO_226.B13]|nr:hypothetical protein [Pleurocapsa sp. MO_226.B13]